MSFEVGFATSFEVIFGISLEDNNAIKNIIANTRTIANPV